MSTIREYIDYLAGKNVSLAIEGEKLKCRAPEGVLTAELQKSILGKKNEIKDFLASERSASEANLALNGTSGLRKHSSTNMPLSYSQERMWFLDQLEEGSHAYIMQMLMQFKGNLDINGVEFAFNKIIQRHDILRTTFKQIDGRPRQLVAKEFNINIEVSDLSNLTAQEQVNQINSRCEVIAKENRVDLSMLPLMRIDLFYVGENDYDTTVGRFERKGPPLEKTGDDYHVLVLTMHHIISDGWSMGIFKNEFSHYYNNYVYKREDDLQKLDYQYSDYALKQLDQGYKKNDLKYWTKQLAELPDVIDLPTDFSRPSVQMFNGESVYFSIPPKDSEGLKKLSHELCVTLPMTLMAIYGVLLHKLMGQNENVVIGSPIANRRNKSEELLIGFFVNTLVYRLKFKENLSFKELLFQLRKTSVEAYEHQSLPFEKLVEELKPDRKLCHSPLFQVMFSFQNTPKGKLEVADLEVKELEQQRKSSVFDLCLFLSDANSDKGLEGTLEFDTALYTEKTINRYVEQIGIIIKSVLEDPNKLVSDIEISTPDETKELKTFLYGQESYYGENKTLQNLFEIQVEDTPDRIALQFDNEQLSYRKLNECANQLARYLVKSGVKVGGTVGLTIYRTPSMIISILAILKVGAAYVPLEPDYPKSRLSYIINDAALKIIITDGSLTKKIDSNELAEMGAKVCHLGVEKNLINQLSVANLGISCFPESLAYLIYTSGTTGRPKGVAIEHRNAISLLHSARQTFTNDQIQTVLAGASFCFDLSVYEFFLPLLNGGKVFLVKDALSLIDMDDEAGLTLVSTTPSAFNQILDACEIPKSIKVVNLAGEALSSTLVDRVYEISNIEAVYNIYGPSETTTYSLTHLCKRGEVITPLGNPICNTQCYVLDANDRDVSLGTIGELHISGPGVSRGYYNKPRLTAEKFVPDLKSSSGKRMYRTGDLVRYKDYHVFYAGRRDHQLKIRGFRVEPEEIRHVIEEHDLIKKALVLPIDNNEGGKDLVAYLMPDRCKIQDSLDIDLAQHEHVKTWKALYEDTYIDERDANINSHDVVYKNKKCDMPSDYCQDISFNTVGWNSSFDGNAIPDDQMEEWLDSTVANILALKPKRVLEIGSGTGLIVARIAPLVDEYLATDFSNRSVKMIDQLVAAIGLKNVKTLQCSADKLFSLIDQQYDLIIINSVAQYFPSSEYFLNVLRSAFDCLFSTGHIYIGDVRNFDQLELFHNKAALTQANQEDTLQSVAKNSSRNMSQERELLFSPVYFYSLAREVKDIASVSVSSRRGKFINELNLFRYDVVLSKLGQDEVSVSKWLEWENEIDLSQLLNDNEQKTNAFGVIGIPHLDLSIDEVLNDYFNQTEPDLCIETSVSKWMSILTQKQKAHTPKELVEIANSFGWDAYVVPSFTKGASKIDVCFVPNGLLSFNSATYKTIKWQLPITGKPLSALTNHPQIRLQSAEITTLMKEHLGSAVPNYMVPRYFVVLDDWPLNKNGKVDIKRLPIPEKLCQLRDTEYKAPSTDIEIQLVEIWKSVLQLTDIGVHDNFFDLGGHSLLATQVISHAAERIGLKIPVRTFIGLPTIHQLASFVEEQLAFITLSRRDFDEANEIEEGEI